MLPVIICIEALGSTMLYPLSSKAHVSPEACSSLQSDGHAGSKIRASMVGATPRSALSGTTGTSLDRCPKPPAAQTLALPLPQP